VEGLPQGVNIAIGAFIGGGSSLLFMIKSFMPRREIEKTISEITKSISDHLETEKETTEKVQNIREELAGNRVEMEWVMSSLASIMEKLGANGVPPPPRRLPRHEEGGG
jgi:hypothetical protein